MKSLYCLIFSSLLITNISCRSKESQSQADQRHVLPEQEAQCSPDGVCILRPEKASSLVPPIVGSGPSFTPGAKTREGTIVKPSTIEKSAAKVARPYPKQLWADSILFSELPLLADDGKIVKNQSLNKNLSAYDRINGFLKVESWYNHKPSDFKGKFVLIEFAASWCSACKRSLKHIEHIHKTFPKELVVISIFETDAASNDDFPEKGAGKDIQHCIGIDTKRRCANALGVYGIPHAILIEPEAGVVVWEGMLHQTGYELDDKLLKKFFAIGLADQADK